MLLHSAQVRRDVIEWTETDGLSGRGEGETEGCWNVCGGGGAVSLQPRKPLIPLKVFGGS